MILHNKAILSESDEEREEETTENVMVITNRLLANGQRERICPNCRNDLPKRIILEELIYNK